MSIFRALAVVFCFTTGEVLASDNSLTEKISNPQFDEFLLYPGYDITPGQDVLAYYEEEIEKCGEACWRSSDCKAFVFLSNKNFETCFFKNTAKLVAQLHSDRPTVVGIKPGMSTEFSLSTPLYEKVLQNTTKIVKIHSENRKTPSLDLHVTKSESSTKWTAIPEVSPENRTLDSQFRVRISKYLVLCVSLEDLSISVDPCVGSLTRISTSSFPSFWVTFGLIVDGIVIVGTGIYLLNRKMCINKRMRKRSQVVDPLLNDQFYFDRGHDYWD